MPESFLKRYTSLPALIYLLQNRKLALLNPNTWDDSNDIHCIEVYKEKRELSVVLAACFTETAETYHHWKVFAGDSSGACITFNRQSLLAQLDSARSIRYGPVEYKTLQEMRDLTPTVDQLPFIKRSGYQDECEFRVLYESTAARPPKKKDIPISIDCIEKITLNPWMQRSLFTPTRTLLASIEGCEGLQGKILRSTLTGNSEWKEIVDDAA